jgi:hypothetical protein
MTNKYRIEVEGSLTLPACHTDANSPAEAAAWFGAEHGAKHRESTIVVTDVVTQERFVCTPQIVTYNVRRSRLTPAVRGEATTVDPASLPADLTAARDYVRAGLLVAMELRDTVFRGVSVHLLDLYDRLETERRRREGEAG